MTGIDKLNQRKRNIVVLFIIGISTVLIAIGVFHERAQRWPYLIIPIVGFVFVLSAMISFNAALRCPNCGASLSEYARKGSVFAFPTTILKCSHCGFNLAANSRKQRQFGSHCEADRGQSTYLD